MSSRDLGSGGPRGLPSCVRDARPRGEEGEVVAQPSEPSTCRRLTRGVSPTFPLPLLPSTGKVLLGGRPSYESGARRTDPRSEPHSGPPRGPGPVQHKGLVPDRLRGSVPRLRKGPDRLLPLAGNPLSRGFLSVRNERKRGPLGAGLGAGRGVVRRTSSPTAHPLGSGRLGSAPAPRKGLAPAR